MPAAAGAGGQAGRGRWGPLPILLLPTGEAILNAGNFWKRCLCVVTHPFCQADKGGWAPVTFVCHASRLEE